LHTGVVDEDVQATGSPNDIVEDVFHGGVIAHVELDPLDSRIAVDPGRNEIRRHDEVPVGSEPLRDRRTDACAAPGHEGRRTMIVVHVASSPALEFGRDLYLTYVRQSGRSTTSGGAVASR
jgi:hypothetical protein